ncbi:hypothetical protein TRICI_004257 [Trichomonascus ciferrii]|uniref:Arginine N-methyltransferase 2 n=1 Tax=Trichomonascus ciferrii TaxID=44093 RepID=A0A642V0T7_9ASCO|nr:hypothetical protein TRICI_004257 [Trichomonascus ciferrii]
MQNTIFELSRFKVEPISRDLYIKKLEECLKGEIPATITTKDVALAEELERKIQNGEEVNDNGEEVDGGDTGSTPLHMICESLEKDSRPELIEIACEMIDVLFQYGGSWMMIDDNNETPGCIALRKQLPQKIYDKFVMAGVRSEVFLRKMTEDVEEPTESGDTASDQKAYLQSELEYTDHKLLTRQNQDGVMMDWEDPIMRRSAELLSECKEQGGIVLNIGFGMGIIDTYLEGYKPKKHYISEAHPKVLEKMRADGWYDKENVVVLEGRWQETIPKLLDEGVYLDGIYYDTFSEHYQDFVDLFDSVVGLLSPGGVFSYFNGLGADRQICYDVYTQVIEVDLADYGLQVSFETIPIQGDNWEGVRKQYWALKEYKLPIIKFMGL